MDILFDTTGIIIETDRLRLRAFQPSDLNDFYAYASVPGVGETAGWPHHDSIETSKAILDSFLEKKESFAVYHKVDEKIIGSLSLHRSWASDDEQYKDLKVKEIGYVLAKDYWGQGLMPEAVGKVIGYGFTALGLDAFTCGHFSANDRSRRVIEKCGFTLVKSDKYYAKQLDKTFDVIKYILFKPTPVEKYYSSMKQN